MRVTGVALARAGGLHGGAPGRGCGKHQFVVVATGKYALQGVCWRNA
jgi:hypothetical protein